MFSEKISPAMVPGLAHLKGKGNTEHMMRIASALIATVSGLVAIGAGATVALNRPFMSLWVGKQYYGGLSMTTALALISVLTVITTALGHVVFSSGNVRLPAGVAFTQLAIKLLLTFPLTHAFGTLGIPVAGACASACALILYCVALPSWTRIMKPARLGAMAAGGLILLGSACDTVGTLHRPLLVVISAGTFAVCSILTAFVSVTKAKLALRRAFCSGVE
jgi:O-antigen/teichoic acid export membrane protein